MNRKTWNANPSRDLSYTSLIVDEQNRAQHAHKITDTARFNITPVNGNLASVIPNITEDGVRQTLPRHYQADTSTRTVFQDGFYDAKDGIAEHVEDPNNTFSAVRALPHMPLNELAPTDPRIRRLKPQYEASLGPGFYNADPLGDKSTGTLTLSPDQVHRTLMYARDPTRASAVFVSPTRGRTAPDIAKESAAPPVVARMTEPDYAYWTSKGCWAPRGDRVIQAERWGKNARETMPPPEDRPQSVYTPAVTTDGHPNSCEAYTSARLTPAYKVAFSSGLPRTLALPLGQKPDTRLQVKSYEDITAAKADVGPGSYNPEVPRMRSSNVAFEAAEPYYSLASGAPDDDNPRATSATTSSGAPLSSLLPPQLQHQLAAAGTLSLLSPGSLPSTPYTAGGLVRSAVAVSQPAVHIGNEASSPTGAGHRSAPTSPSAQRAAAARAERAAAAALLWSVSSRGSAEGFRTAAGVRGSPLGSSVAFPGGGGGFGGHQCDSQDTVEEEGGGGGYGAPRAPPSPSSWSRVQSAPPSPHNATGSVTASMRAAQAKQFTKLVFLQRHTPCSSLLRSHLIVAADLKKERQRLRNPS